MLFTEWPFPLFLVIVFAVHWVLPAGVWRKSWLLLASYVFYAGWDWRFLSLIWLSTVVDHVAAARMHATVDESLRRRWLTFSLVINLGVLGFFKYFDFFVDSAIELAQVMGWNLSEPVLRIVLPVGISFYTFQTLSYTLDVHARRLKPVDSFLDFALFVAFFPQLVAGPIVRAAEFLPQLRQPASWSQIAWRPCLWLILCGYIKKSCLSDHLATFVDPAFADPATIPAGTMWMVVVMYAAQIFCDFSGYSDMAIGMAGLLGYVLPVNFRGPYLSVSISEFWHRWHISLSTWLRDYLYIPLGGNRGRPGNQYRNLMVTMLLGGLWHGAGWNFVIWGGLHGGALICCRLWATREKPLQPVIAWSLTMLWVGWTWVWFRTSSVESAFEWTRGLCSIGPWNSAWSIPMAAVLTGWLVQWAGQQERVRAVARRIPDWAFACILGGGWAVALSFAQTEHQPFIYFQF